MSNNTFKFGITSWDEVEIKQANSFQRSKDVYMRLENGNNVVRCITRPHQYLVHNFKEEGDSGFGTKIMCSSFHKKCPLCEAGDRPKRRWLVGVIDRKTQASKILDMSVSVFKAIQELSRDEDYGNPEGYDIDIKVDKQGGATGYYTVIPKPKKPLSANDIDIKNGVNHEDLLKKCTPPTPEKVQEKLDQERAKKSGGGKAAPARNSKAASTPAPVDMNGASEDDFVFPAVS
ncbi:MAG TPA: hypothetical protein VM577_06120 [Anaerovoracaceae bacterium]|nr:hypothetical protein [Anaerovoracaceae bacterium]